MELTKIKIKDFESLPFVYDDDGNINKLELKVGDIYRMRDDGRTILPGDRVSVYKVLRLTQGGDESMMTTLIVE